MSQHVYRDSIDVFEYRGTGSHEDLADYEIIERSFADYIIKLRLTADGRFVDILEIKVSKDFSDHRQKRAALGSWDASEYYTK